VLGEGTVVERQDEMAGLIADGLDLNGLFGPAFQRGFIDQPNPMS